MNGARSGARDPDRQGGMVLATVLVFLVVLTLTAFSAAALTRTNLQLVNNEQNEKTALYVAESGIAEAVLRLGMSSTTVSVDGSSFDPKITPDATQSAWDAQVLFSSNAPQTTGSTFTTPTLQPASSRQAYSTATSGDPGNLAIRWLTCTAVGTGCSAVGAIRQIDGNNVLQVTSTGQAGAARRTITVYLTQGGNGAVVLEPGTGASCSTTSLSISGSGAVSFTGGVTVNSQCTNALRMSGSSTLSAPSGGIDVVGGYQFTGSATSTPIPTTSAQVATDPFLGIAAPDPAALGLSTRNGSPSNPSTQTLIGGGSTTLSPGIYYGGISIGGSKSVTLQPGVYYIAGGGFSVGGAASVSGSGVTIYNTVDTAMPTGVGAYGAISFTSNGTIDLSAPASGTTAGMLLFQDRSNPQTMTLGGRFSGTLDGAIYTQNARLDVSGGSSATKKLRAVVDQMTISTNANFQSPDTPVAGTGGGYEQLAWRDF